MKLTVISINLNNASGIEQTIGSVLEQTFTDYEYIIIDGGSIDGSVDVINKNKNRLAYFVSETDSGIYNAMNKAIVKAKGEYCLFLNSGDFLYGKDALLNVFKNNLNEGIVLCKGLPYSKINRRKKTFPSISNSEITFNDIYHKALNHQATFIRTELFEKYGLYDERYKIISDRVFILKTLGLSHVSFKFLDVVVSVYDMDGISSDVSAYYNSELIPAFKELIPPRIIDDYEKDYINLILKIKKYALTWVLFRLLVKGISMFERLKK